MSAGDDASLVVWDLVSGQNQRLVGHTAKVMDLAISPDGRTIASRVGIDGSVFGRSSPMKCGDQTYLEGHQNTVSGVAFNSDGKTLYSVSSDGTLREWKIDEPTESRILVNHEFGINKILVDDWAGWIAYGAVDGVTRVVELNTGLDIGTFTLDRRPILAMAISPDKTQIASAMVRVSSW